MTFPWPAFLSRALLLRRARLALESGDHGRCLDILRDPRLVLSARAERFRQVALEQMSREARRCAAQGETGAVEGIVARLSTEAPERAHEIRRELGLALSAPSGAMIGKILSEVRSSLAARSTRAPSTTSAAGAARTNGSTRAARDPALAPRDSAGTARRATIPGVVTRASQPSESDPEIVRFHLAVDDGGECFVVGGPALILGHLRSGAASLPFLADVENEHVRFTCTETFHSGIQWKLERIAARAVTVNGRVLGEGPESLSDGDEVVLAQNLGLRFRLPDATSGSAVLDLSSGAECQGVRRIVLLAPGGAGRVRIGSKKNRHIPVADLRHEIALEWGRGEISVSCAGGVRLAGGALDPSPASSISIACPPRAAQSFVLGARENARPPFAIHMRPPEPPPSTGAHRS